MKHIILSSIIILTMFGCKMQHSKSKETVNKVSTTQKSQFVSALPHIVIYKTTKDYRHNVPVTLSEDKSQIVAYPHPTDLFVGENLALPTQLNNGYLLDNRGIGKNVAFLKFTYEEYSKLQALPSLIELYENIIDKDPLTELWDCGIKANFTDLKKQLNEWIDKNMLEEKGKRVK